MAARSTRGSILTRRSVAIEVRVPFSSSVLRVRGRLLAAVAFADLHHQDRSRPKLLPAGSKVCKKPVWGGRRYPATCQVLSMLATQKHARFATRQARHCTGGDLLLEQDF
jgi:hypothetical protein